MKISVLIKVCAAFALATGFTNQVLAATLTGSYSIGALTFSCNASEPGSGTLTNLSSGCTDTLNSGSFSVSGSGQATYDTLRATASAGFSGEPKGAVTGLLSATGKASYQDMVTIDILGSTGETVDLVFRSGLNGDLAASSDGSTYAQATASLNVRVNGYNVNIGRKTTTTGVNTDNDLNPGRVEIVLGTPFSVLASLTVTARVDPLTAINRIFTGDALADFGSSAGITSFELFESGTETLISSWDLTSESGEFGFYTVVPVPASVWLFGSGLLGLVGMARRKKAA